MNQDPPRTYVKRTSDLTDKDYLLSYFAAITSKFTTGTFRDSPGNLARGFAYSNVYRDEFTINNFVLVFANLFDLAFSEKNGHLLK